MQCPEALWGLLYEEHLRGHKCARTGSSWHVGGGWLKASKEALPVVWKGGG